MAAAEDASTQVLGSSLPLPCHDRRRRRRSQMLAADAALAQLGERIAAVHGHHVLAGLARALVSPPGWWHP